MPKPQDIFQLARQEAVRVTASPQAWQSFLYTAAHNYHTTYLNQLLIHAQQPDAAACASMEYWNTKANRLVMRGSRSITVLQRRQGVAVTKPVFAIGDTTLLSQTHTGGPWQVTDTTRPLLLQGKSDDWLAALAQDGVSNEADRARRILERNVADSTLQWAQPDEQMQLLQALVTQSAVYMARLRIGLPVQDEDFPAFQSVNQFDTYQISLCLGGYVQAAAEPMLNAIGREALRLNRDSIAIKHEPVHNGSTPTQLNSREEAVTYDVHEEPRRLPDSEPFPAEPAEPVSEPLREAASGISGAERADALRPADAGGHAADELQSNRTDSTADGGQDPARADADHPTAGPQNEPAGLGTADQQSEKAGGGDNPSDAVRSLTETPAQAESEPSPSAFALPEFPADLLPQLLAAETSSRASNAEYLTFYNKNPLLIDRLRFVRESYKDIFTELLLADDTRVGFHRQDNGLLVWQGAYLTRSAETLLSWRAVANALNDLIEQHELITAIDPKELPQAEEQLSFELPDGSPTSAEDDRLEKDDFLTPEKQETVIRSALPVAEYNAPQMDDGSVITDEEINLALAVGSNFENSKFRIYQQFTTTQGDHAAFLKKEYSSGGRSWDYQSGAHGWVDHGPAGLKLILTNEEGRFERRLLWRAAAKRIAYLIEMQRFLTPQELEQYPAWAAEQQEAASTVRDEPGNVPDTRPICAEGSVVYLEDDHRFTVERIGQFDVHLQDEEVPLFGRAISREEFQRQLDANPRNAGMMLSEQQREALVQAQTEQALSYIEDYLKDEFEITEPDFSDLTRIDLGYTTTEDEKHVIQVYADLEHCTVTKLVDDTLYAQERYGSLDDLNQAVLSNLDFDSLMEIDLDEAEEHEPQGNALPTDESAAQAPTNYLAPYEPKIPTGAKAKFAANLNAIRTLKQIEQRGTPATEAEQVVLAGYLGWGGLADAFDPNKDSWHSEYEQLKDLLTPEEYAAAQESTLTAFYTPPAVIHAMYRALTRMGCVGGNVLEPSMGVGAFFGHRSGSFDTNNAKLYGVELDSVSGRIAQQLYQKAKIQICGYEKADLDKLNDQSRKDDVITFEELGVDSLMVDEAHYFKNAMVTTKMTRVAGISQTESQKASDMYMKCMYMDELTGGHGIVFATGTPISNSMTEMYIMMRYLQYGLLEQEGLLNFDAWASTFGESVTAIELTPEGNGYRSKTRFAKFYNLPELMNMFKQCADIQTADMLKLPVPEITGGKPTIVKLPPSELQRQMVAALGERAEAVRNRLVAPNEDNMLRITNDGRKLALDQRLMNPLLPDDPDSKANACVERVFSIWERTKAQRSTQMIFCDLSTPRTDGFDVYNDIRDKLVVRGIPKEEVQFIHDADTEAKKAELFGKVRSGAVRVLMGSTQKMGAGTNVQTRLCALHHLDCPWRPADIAQRNGRMVRQGNMNKEVSIFIYITEATFDAYSYQLVENKQKFISQIMTSKSPARSCEDLDEAALSYAEVKALAAGNPMIKEKMDLDIQVARLRTLKAAYDSQHYRLEDALTGIFLREIRGTECRLQAFEKDVQTAKVSQSCDKDGKLVFSIELDGKTYDKREDAGKALLGLVGAAVRADHPVSVGHYAGFEVTVAYVPLSKVFVAHLVGEATHTTELGSDAAGNMVRLQNVVAALPQEISGLRNNLQQLRVQLDSAKEELQQPFLQEQELNEKSARLAELDALLNVGNDAPVLEGEAEVVNEDDSVRTPREENELER